MAVDNNEYIPIQISEVIIGNVSDNFFHLVFFKENDQKQTFPIIPKDAERILSLLNNRFNSFAIYAIDQDLKIKVAPKNPQNKNVADFINDINHIYASDVFDANDTITQLQNHFNTSNIQTQIPQATYAIVPGALATTNNNNANNTQNNTTPTNYFMSEVKTWGAMPGFHVKFLLSSSQQSPTETEVNEIARNILKLNGIKTLRYNQINIGIAANNEIQVKVTISDDPTKNMIHILKILKEIWSSYKSTQDFLFEEGKKLVEHHLNLPSDKAEKFANDIIRWGFLNESSNASRNTPKNFFDKFIEQASELFSSNLKKS